MLKISTMIVILLISSCLSVQFLLQIFQSYVVKYLQINGYPIFLRKCTFHYSMVFLLFPANAYQKILRLAFGLSIPIAHPNAVEEKGRRFTKGESLGVGGDVTFLPSWPPPLQAKWDSPRQHSLSGLGVQHKREVAPHSFVKPDEKVLGSTQLVSPELRALGGHCHWKVLADRTIAGAAWNGRARRDGENEREKQRAVGMYLVWQGRDVWIAGRQVKAKEGSWLTAWKGVPPKTVAWWGRGTWEAGGMSSGIRLPAEQATRGEPQSESPVPCASWKRASMWEPAVRAGTASGRSTQLVSKMLTLLL